jgi:hypothetical protein
LWGVGELTREHRNHRGEPKRLGSRHEISAHLVPAHYDPGVQRTDRRTISDYRMANTPYVDGDRVFESHWGMAPRHRQHPCCSSRAPVPLATPPAPVALGAIVGPTQVVARAVEMAISRYHHPIWTMLAATIVVAMGRSRDGECEPRAPARRLNRTCESALTAQRLTLDRGPGFKLAIRNSRGSRWKH